MNQCCVIFADFFFLIRNCNKLNRFLFSILFIYSLRALEMGKDCISNLFSYLKMATFQEMSFECAKAIDFQEFTAVISN